MRDSSGGSSTSSWPDFSTRSQRAYTVSPPLKIRFQQKRLRRFTVIVVLSPDERGQPISILAEWQVVNDRRGCAMSFHVRLERFGAFDVAMRNLQRQIRRRAPGKAAAT